MFITFSLLSLRNRSHVVSLAVDGHQEQLQLSHQEKRADLQHCKYPHFVRLIISWTGCHVISCLWAFLCLNHVTGDQEECVLISTKGSYVFRCIHWFLVQKQALLDFFFSIIFIHADCHQLPFLSRLTWCSITVRKIKLYMMKYAFWATCLFSGSCTHSSQWWGCTQLSAMEMIVGEWT